MSMQTARRRFPRARRGVGLAVLGLLGCQTSPPPAPPPMVDSSAVMSLPGGRTHVLVTERSQLRVLVYRGGPMARLGHNHVIASRNLRGEVVLGAAPDAVAFDIRLPVNELTVDEPELRAAAGPDFPPEVPQSAREGTRRNMLSPALLDGANYPEIRLRARDATVVRDGLDVGVEVTIKDQRRVLRVPVRLERSDREITARGEFPLKQSELGLQPFSAALGALVVLDDMRVQFEITARAVD